MASTIKIYLNGVVPKHPEDPSEWTMYTLVNKDLRQVIAQLTKDGGLFVNEYSMDLAWIPVNSIFKIVQVSETSV